MWNLSINAASDRVVAQLDQDGCGLHAEKFGEQLCRMLGVSSTTMQARKNRHKYWLNIWRILANKTGLIGVPPRFASVVYRSHFETH